MGAAVVGGGVSYELNQATFRYIHAYITMDRYRYRSMDR